MKAQKVLIEAIEFDGSTQARAMLSDEAVADYAQLMESGTELPPIVVFHDGSAYWLADGYHRYHAASKLSHKLIRAEVHKGTKEDAAWFAAGANLQHGLRRTNADKRRAVEMALRLRPESSDRAIAEHCGVSDKTVAAVRDGGASTAEIPQSYPDVAGEGGTRTERVGRDGRTIDTAKIGRTTPAPRKPDPEPVQPPRRGEIANDATGHPIPAAIVEQWMRDNRSALDWMAALRAFAKPVQEGHDASLPLLRSLNRSKFDAMVDSLRLQLTQMVRPHAVCPYCDGRGEGCMPCLERGWMTESQWSTVPRDIRGGRE